MRIAAQLTQEWTTQRLQSSLEVEIETEMVRFESLIKEKDCVEG